MTEPYLWKRLPQVDPERIAAIVDLTALQAVEGYVWCDKHGEVHTDSLNPYGYAETIPGNDFCKHSDHRALYMEPDDDMTTQLERDEARRVEPEPVRHAPVPLTVRRHTEESMKIWRANLLDAMPADMPQEDRERIADSLLEFGIRQGNELRRKRIIDKLMLAAEEMEDRQPLGAANEQWRKFLEEWSALMVDAAEEIKSFL